MFKIKSNKYIVLLLFISIFLGVIFNILYNNSPKSSIKIDSVRSCFNYKMICAEKTATNIKDILIHYSVDSLKNYAFDDADHSFFVYRNNTLLFWSNNNLDIANLDFAILDIEQQSKWHSIQVPNAFCIGKTISCGDIQILSIIKIKNNYSFQNKVLSNSFADDLNLDFRTQVVNGKSSDAFAVSDTNGNYLFTVAPPKVPVFDPLLGKISALAYAIAFLAFFLIYSKLAIYLNKSTIKLPHFIFISGFVGALLGVLMYFNIPSLFFQNDAITSFQYASSSFLTTICHLSILSFYVCSTVYLFCFHVDKTNFKSLQFRFLLQAILLILLLVFQNALNGITDHSNVQVLFFQLKDFQFIGVFLHILLSLWGIAIVLFFHTIFNEHTHHLTFKKGILFNLFITLILLLVSYFSAFGIGVQAALSYLFLQLSMLVPFFIKFLSTKYIKIVWYCGSFALLTLVTLNANNEQKTNQKFNILCQNYYYNEQNESDKITDVLFEELDAQIANDNRLLNLQYNDDDSLQALNDYLSKTYLKGYWNKYDIRLNATKTSSSLNNDYVEFIAKSGLQIQETHFYTILTTENDMSYMGVFGLNNLSDSVNLFLEFYPRTEFKSYSFPNFLINETLDFKTKFNISIAKYDNNKLVYASGKKTYTDDFLWMSNTKDSFYIYTDNQYAHYIYRPQKQSYIVFSSPIHRTNVFYLLNYFYLLIIYLSVVILLTITLFRNRKSEKLNLGLINKFQISFIVLLIISFIAVFYQSVKYFKKNNQDKQIADLKNKREYIQKALQERYYWNQDLNALNTKALNYDLQDISYAYHTDIHIFNNDGDLIGSSQPLIFNKHLVGHKINSKPYFTTNSNIIQYENIGKLKYLTAYTDFINGDFLQIGFIAIPQFFSQEELNDEINDFVSVVLNIYLIIILLAIVISLVIGKQLSAPLIMLESKLKEMRIGRRNEKIVYNNNDEIGQLVQQYNRTVDDLEQSAKLLAQNERENAWKTMAKQVAHEINNPLTPIKLTIQQLVRLKKSNDDRFDSYLEHSATTLIEQIDNLAHIASTFSNFAKMPEANFTKTDIAERLTSVINMFTNSYPNTVFIHGGKQKEVFVYADPEQMVQVFNNLIINAIQAIPSAKAGRIEIDIQDDLSQIFITIADNGTGISDEVVGKIFTPSFTTKKTGMGLGLAIVKKIIEISGGDLSFTTTNNVGTCFKIILPTYK